MPKYYVPVVLVVEAEFQHEAAARADVVLDHLVELAPKGILGTVWPETLVPSVASDKWWPKDHALRVDGDTVEVVEV